MGQKDQSSLNNSPQNNETPVTWQMAAIAVTMAAFITTIVAVATTNLGRLTWLAALIGFVTTTYYLYHMPSPRAAIGTGLYGAAILLAVSPFLFILPEITTISGPTPRATDGDLGEFGYIIALWVIGPAIAFLSFLIFSLGYTVEQSHRQRTTPRNTEPTSSNPTPAHTESRHTIGMIAVAMGFLNALFIRIAVDRSWHQSGVVDPYSSLRETLPVPELLNSPDLFPWFTFLLTFTITTFYISRNENPRTAISTGLYSAAALLALTPAIILELTEPDGFLRHFPSVDVVVTLIIFGLGFYTIAISLFYFGYKLKRPPTTDDSM